MNALTRAVRWLCLFAWTSLLLLTIYNSFQIPEHFIAAGVDVGPDLSHRQNVLYAWIASGLGVTLLGLRFERWWMLTTIISALIYLVGWYLRGPMYMVGPMDGYRLKWQAATELDAVIPFLIRDILVPGIFFLALFGALLSARKMSKNSAAIH